MVHGDYNYHNVLNTAEGTAVTNFEHARIDIQMGDLYYFMRKAMEKYRWKQKLGSRILEAYEEERRIEPMERTFLGLCLAYPEKFWKTASSYAARIKRGCQKKVWKNSALPCARPKKSPHFGESVFTGSAGVGAAEICRGDPDVCIRTLHGPAPGSDVQPHVRTTCQSSADGGSRSAQKARKTRKILDKDL